MEPRRYRITYVVPPLNREPTEHGARVSQVEDGKYIPWAEWYPRWSKHFVTLEAYDAVEAEQRLQFLLVKEGYHSAGNGLRPIYRIHDIEPT